MVVYRVIWSIICPLQKCVMTWTSLRFFPLQLVFQVLPSASDEPPVFFSVLQGTPHPKSKPVQLTLIVVGRRNRRVRVLVYHFEVGKMVALSVIYVLPEILRRIAISLFLARCMHIEARCIQC